MREKQYFNNSDIATNGQVLQQRQFTVTDYFVGRYNKNKKK